MLNLDADTSMRSSQMASECQAEASRAGQAPSTWHLSTSLISTFADEVPEDEVRAVTREGFVSELLLSNESQMDLLIPRRLRHLQRH